MDSNDYFEKTYLEYYFLKDILDRDKQYHIDGFVKNDLDDINTKVDDVNILTLLIKYILDSIESSKVIKSVVIHNDVDIYKIKGYTSIKTNKQYDFISYQTNNLYKNDLNDELIVYGFFTKMPSIFENIQSFIKKKNYHEINYSSKTLLEDFKKLFHNIQLYNINHIIHKAKLEHTKLFFKNEKYNDKNNKSFKILKDFNDVLKYKFTEEYDSSTYAAFFNSHQEYLYETIINLNKPDLINGYLNDIKIKNSIIHQKIENENSIISNTLNNIVIRNLTKLRFPNLFNTNHNDCLFRNNKEFSVEKLPDKYKNVILLEHKKNQEYIKQVLNNKCDHKKIKLYNNNNIDFQEFTILNEYIDNEQSESNDSMIVCKLCNLDLICPHEYLYIQLLKEKVDDNSNDKSIFNYDKYINQVNQIITNKYSSDASLQYKFYCKICGGFLSDDHNALDMFKSINMIKSTTIKSVDEELKKYIIRESFYITSSYIDIETDDIEQKTMVWAITDIVIGHLSEINQKITKKKNNSEQQDILLKFHIKIIIFTIIILLINQTKKIGFKGFTKSPNLKDLLNQCFTIFIKYASTTITKLSIQYIDIKSLLIEYYKLIVTNTITFKNEKNVDEDVRSVENSINYKILKSYLNTYLNIKTNDIEVILNKNIIQPNKNKQQPKDENLYDSIKIDKYDNKLVNNNRFNSYLTFVKNLKYETNEPEPKEKVFESKKIKYENILKLPFSSIKFGLNDKKLINYKLDNIEKIDINRFYINYTYKCPEGEFHNLVDESCTKCKINSSLTNTRDSDYFQKYKNKYKIEIDKEKSLKQNKIDFIIDNYKKPVSKKVKLDTSLNNESINIISNLYNIDIDYLLNLGSIEGIDYNKKYFTSIVVDPNERILKLTNYLLYLTVEYNKFRHNNKSYPKISINLIDMIESYKNILTEDELINLLLNTIYNNIINIYNINNKDNDLFLFTDTLTHSIIKFDEIYSLYDYSTIKYLLRKSKNEDEVVIDTDQYDTNDVNEYDDLFGNDLFDESFDGGDDDDGSNKIKLDDY